jgi:hypothetical protein
MILCVIEGTIVTCDDTAYFFAMSPVVPSDPGLVHVGPPSSVAATVMLGVFLEQEGARKRERLRTYPAGHNPRAPTHMQQDRYTIAHGVGRHQVEDFIAVHVGDSNRQEAYTHCDGCRMDACS